MLVAALWKEKDDLACRQGGRTSPALHPVHEVLQASMARATRPEAHCQSPYLVNHFLPELMRPLLYLQI